MDTSKLKFYKNLNVFLCLLLVISITFLTINKKENKLKKLENSNYNSYTEYLFLGDSITNNYTLQKYYPEFPIINSGIGGDRTQHILDTLNNRVFKYKPKKVIILAGINDLTHFEDPSYVSKNIELIAKKIKEKLPKCEIYIESIYPVNYSWKNRYGDTVPSMDDMINNIKTTNKQLKKICEENNYKYLDLFDILEENDMLANIYSKDGIHLSDEGYEIVTKFLKDRVFNVKDDYIGTQI